MHIPSGINPGKIITSLHIYSNGISLYKLILYCECMSLYRTVRVCDHRIGQFFVMHKKASYNCKHASTLLNTNRHYSTAIMTIYLYLVTSSTAGKKQLHVVTATVQAIMFRGLEVY